MTASATPRSIEDVIAAWPAIPEHVGEDGTRCPFSGVISQAGQCPDECL